MLSNSRQSPSTHSNHHLLSLCHPLTLIHPLLFSLYRILGHSITILTPLRCLLIHRYRALALPRRSLTPPHCPLTSSCLPFILLDRLLMPLWCLLTFFRCHLMPSRYLLTHPVTLECILLARLCLPIVLPFNTSPTPSPSRRPWTPPHRTIPLSHCHLMLSCGPVLPSIPPFNTPSRT